MSLLHPRTEPPEPLLVIHLPGLRSVRTRACFGGAALRARDEPGPLDGHRIGSRATGTPVPFVDLAVVFGQRLLVPAFVDEGDEGRECVRLRRSPARIKGRERPAC